MLLLTGIRSCSKLSLLWSLIRGVESRPQSIAYWIVGQSICTTHQAKLLNAENNRIIDIRLITSNTDIKETGYTIDLLVRGVNEEQSHKLMMSNAWIR